MASETICFTDCANQQHCFHLHACKSCSPGDSKLCDVVRLNRTALRFWNHRGTNSMKPLKQWQKTRSKPVSKTGCKLNSTAAPRVSPLLRIRGEKIPHALGQPLHILCIIRGIHYHPGFGRELRGALPIFTRAMNARSIMSNIILDFDSPDEVPYCIWHPVTALEETYRELARRWPHMAYKVG